MLCDTPEELEKLQKFVKKVTPKPPPVPAKTSINLPSHSDSVTSESIDLELTPTSLPEMGDPEVMKGFMVTFTEFFVIDNICRNT